MALPENPQQTSLTQVIPSYLYWQYNDDLDLQAFVTQFNLMAQQYVDWFVTLNLPVYTSETIVGGLLDWVALGLYGEVRPALPSGESKSIGPINSYAFNTHVFNFYELVGPQNVYATTDDVFKRILTWNFYKGDGYTFDIRWLKRRIQRFLTGENGADPGVNQTYQISVTFGLGNQVNIDILSGNRVVTGGSMLNGGSFASQPFNNIKSTYTQLTPFELAPILKSAIDSRVVQLPFQYEYVVHV